MKIGLLDFGAVGWKSVGSFMVFATLAWMVGSVVLNADSRSLMSVMNVKLDYDSPSSSAALYEVQMGQRVVGLVVAVCAKYPWLSGLFGYRDRNTPRMISYMHKAYKPTKDQLVKGMWLYETGIAVAAETSPPTTYQAVLDNVLYGDQLPDVEYIRKEAQRTVWQQTWGVITQYVMPLANLGIGLLFLAAM